MILKQDSMKQTAVEWLEQQLFNKLGKFTKGDIDQAKEMEKEQIIEAWNDGVLNWDSEKEVEQYYNETYEHGK
jgi:hypothetical protein